MSDSGVCDDIATGGVDTDDVESDRERIFTVGEVVEVWEGACVRGYRLAPGMPVNVKRVEGNGVYAIKMVGSNRGKYRLVGWKNLYKEGSFGKNVCRTDSVRVRGKARLREIAQAEAEARLGGELRQTRRELAKAEERQLDIATKGEHSLQKQAREARQSEKDLTARHKRQLEDMRVDLDRRHELANQERQELYRQGRQKTREVLRECEKTQTELDDAMAEKSRLVKRVRRGTATLEGVKKDRIGWEEKYRAQQDKMLERETLLTLAQRTVVEKTRQHVALVTKCEALEQQLEKCNKDINEHAEHCRKVCLSFVSLLFRSPDSLFSLQRSGRSKKKETKKRKGRGKPCSRR